MQIRTVGCKCAESVANWQSRLQICRSRLTYRRSPPVTLCDLSAKCERRTVTRPSQKCGPPPVRCKRRNSAKQSESRALQRSPARSTARHLCAASSAFQLSKARAAQSHADQNLFLLISGYVLFLSWFQIFTPSFPDSSA